MKENGGKMNDRKVTNRGRKREKGRKKGRAAGRDRIIKKMEK
jgi:hypothetical protein